MPRARLSSRMKEETDLPADPPPVKPLPSPAPQPSSDSAPPRRAASGSAASPAWRGDALIAGVAAGDGRALDSLYKACGDRLFSMALHWLRDEGAAREAVQDCFVKVWRRAATYDPAKSEAFTWCTMILRGLCVDHMRKRGVRAAVWQDWESAGPLEGSRCGVEDLFFRETVNQVRQGLASLNEDERRSVAAALFDTATSEELAGRWQVPVGTVKTKIHRAMEKLRGYLRNREEGV